MYMAKGKVLRMKDMMTRSRGTHAMAGANDGDDNCPRIAAADGAHMHLTEVRPRPTCSLSPTPNEHLDVEPTNPFILLVCFMIFVASCSSRSP